MMQQSIYLHIGNEQLQKDALRLFAIAVPGKQPAGVKAAVIRIVFYMKAGMPSTR